MNEEERKWYRPQCSKNLKEMCDLLYDKSYPVTIYDCWHDLQLELRSTKGNLAQIRKRYSELKAKKSIK